MEDLTEPLDLIVEFVEDRMEVFLDLDLRLECVDDRIEEFLDAAMEFIEDRMVEGLDASVETSPQPTLAPVIS